MICWHCHWGMSRPVKAIYDKYLALLDGDDTGLNFGPGHIVWEDENFDDNNIQSCIDTAQQYRHNLTDEQLKLVIASLQALLLVPIQMREEPEDYDGENPANFPPPEGWV